MRKIFILVAFLSCLLFVPTAFGLNTLYGNKSGYNNKTGYDNKIAYSAFFNGHSPKERKINVQRGRQQAVITVDQKEEKIVGEKGVSE